MQMVDKRELSERDICTKYITPAITNANWDLHEQIREEVTLTAGRIIVRGRMHARGEQSRADYILYHKPNLPIAVVEAKDNNHRIGDGMQQALKYAEALDIPFAFSSNGDGFLFHDRTGSANPVEVELTLEQFPSHDELWRRFSAAKNITPDVQSALEFPYYDDASGRAPRYYQTKAINRTIEAVVRGQDRILLVMATGTGKTYTAFQIIWRLWKSKRKKRILFLADRNILVDQTKNNDFKPFGQAMTKITNRDVNKAFEIYLSLYQAVTGTEEENNIYKQFSRDFFDLVIVDECHRSSAAEDSNWREILEYFSDATQIGLTATPKETKDVSNIAYFGKPIYTYSLKQGIEDGYLAPYKVIRIDFDKDLQGWRPEKGKLDKHGYEINDRIYNQKDFDRELVLEKRTELVAKKITEYLQATDPYQKTIVFCEDVDHADRMRRHLVNLNPSRAAENRRYVMRITGDDNEGKAELDNFINPESRYPVIATTSKLLSTGVDVQTCKLIVLDQRIQSMTEFKQVIGRGTRVNEDYDKYWFAIMDFKRATELFADPAFDGEPVQIYAPNEDESPVPPEPSDENDYGDQSDCATGSQPTAAIIGGGGISQNVGGITKFYVDDVPVSVVDVRTQYYGPDGRLITESMHDYTRGCVKKQIGSLDEFLRKWSDAEKKKVIIDELSRQGVLWEPLAEEVQQKSGKLLDPFDLICHVVFGQPPLTRKERAERVKKRNYFTKYGDQARKVLEALLDKYADTGIEHIEDIKVLQLDPFNKLGTAPELVQAFGGKLAYLTAIKELEDELYKDKAGA
jgi:type I restriction enzyme R subunit